MVFLGVYRALYDYAPQSDEELQISDGDLLFVLEKSTDDDWWKAKKKAASDDDDEPEGLIPSNYIEEATPIYSAKALYDYTKQTDEELSFTEDTQLDVYDTSDPDWTLVGSNGEYGFAPAIYIEVGSSAPAAAAPPPEPAAPPMPARPELNLDKPLPGEADYEPPSGNPAAALAGIIAQRTGGASAEPAPIRERQLAAPPPPMVAPQQYTPEESDEEPAPPMPTRPRSEAPMSPPEPRYTSPPMQRYDSPPPARSPEPRIGVKTSLPHRSISQGYPPEEDPGLRSPGGYHLYNVHEMVSAMGRNKKMPTTLGINVGRGMIMISPEKTKDGPSQEWTADKLTHYSIEGKHVFVELVRPSKSVDFHAGAKDTAKEIVASLGELAGAVRGEGLKEVLAASAGSNGSGRKKGHMVYEFLAQGLDEVTVAIGDEVIVLDDTKSSEWWMVRRLKNGKEGVVPSSYVEVTGNMERETISGLESARSTVEQNRLEEQRLARDAARRDRPKAPKDGLGLDLPERASSLLGDAKREERRAKEATKTKPKQDRVRTWTDRSGTFKVEAEFIGLRDGKIHLHKQNGVKIAVPVTKMAVEDLEYVEAETGLSLDDDKPLSDIKRRSTLKGKSPQSRSVSGAGATVQKDQHDWFDFFLGCGVNPQICERYAGAFARDEMSPEILPDVNEKLLRTLGLKEGDILRVMKFLDNKYERNKSGDDKGESAPGGLFSGPDGVLRNNTRKGRPAPAVQTNDVVDEDAFKPKDASSEAKATPLASAPARNPTGGFEDDAWDVKPSKTETPAAAPAAAPAPAVAEPPKPQPRLNDDLSLLALPLQPAPTGASPAPAVAPPAPAEPTQSPQQQQQGADQAIFDKIAALRPQQTGYQRPAPPMQQGMGPGIPMPPPPRAASAPGFNPQQSAFPPPPLHPQYTGVQQPMQTGFQQAQVAPPGQSLQELQMQQQYQQQYQQPTGYGGYPQQQQNGAMPPMPPMPQQYTSMQPQPTGFQPQSQFGQSQFGQPQMQGYQMQQAGSPFADPPRQSFQPTPSGLVNSFAPQPTGFQQQPAFQQQQPTFQQTQPTGVMNGAFGQAPPQLPPQQTGGVLGPMAPLIPQKTGPPPPVRFGVQPPVPKLVPQKTGRAELSRASKCFRWITFHVIDADKFQSSSEPIRILDVLSGGDVEWRMMGSCLAHVVDLSIRSKKCIYCVIDGIWTLVRDYCTCFAMMLGFSRGSS